MTLVARNLEKEGVIICCRGYMQTASRDALQRRSCECCGRVKGYIERLHAAHQWEECRALGIFGAVLSARNNWCVQINKGHSR